VLPRDTPFEQTGALAEFQDFPEADLVGRFIEGIAPSGATKGADQTILGQLTPDALSWEGVSGGEYQPDDMDGQRSKDAASSSNISVSPRYSGRVLVPF